MLTFLTSSRIPGIIKDGLHSETSALACGCHRPAEIYRDLALCCGRRLVYISSLAAVAHTLVLPRPYFTPLTQSSLSLDAVAAVTRSKEKQASPVNGSVAIQRNVQHGVMEHASLAQAKCFGSSQRCQNICVIITTIIFHQFEPKHLNDNDLNHFYATMKVFLFRMKCV